ncbi:hypothetical protein BT96DRAFT_808685 [Gymnopus androsaceus JB14]|uniref:Uncharacterized protein n=1 Tax=Gymnopus androsaceus JB14 TaxID=1447944 RepID=A0A6A4IFI4_9AGAR|nr:hypothetical protein BT96DRAFT_808685 [Gymnopus androsaceus JB14]
MRFFSALFSLLAVATTAVVAQTADIGAPADMTEVPAGSSFTAMIQRPDTISSSTEIAVVIGLLTCLEGCPTPAQEMGTILYNGGFDPQFTTTPGTGAFPPHQNFTLTVPANFPKGNAQMGVAHFFLLGVSFAILARKRSG